MTQSINELKSYTEYNVSTPTSVFTIGFQYEYNVDHINVYVDGVEATAAGYTVQHDSHGTISLTPAVPNGVVRLVRETDIDTSAHTFSAGAKFTAGNMDENFKQIRHAQQEVRDGFRKLSTDTYEIIDTLQDVAQSAQDAADAANDAAEVANDAAAQVSDKVDRTEGAALPYNPALTYEEGAVVVKDVILQQWKGGGWINVSAQEVKKYLIAAGIDEAELDDDYNYLMQRLAQIAVDKGWDASFVVDGNMTQHQINAEQENKNLLFDKFMLNLVTPEMFGAKANDPSFDNTTALNNAFLTGKSIYSTPDKTYYVDGILNSKGQELIGGWKIHTSRFNLGTVATHVTQPNTTVIKMLYLETAYDLSELLFIKQLGFNIVNHYGYFSAVPADAAGTFGLLLDNAKTAGLMVNMGCENFEAQHDLPAFIHYYKDHPAVFGFSVFDEPGARGFSIAEQQNKINTIRAITGKHLSFVDNTGGDDPFNQKTNYDVDILFVDWYSHTQTGTLEERIEKDLQDMRYEFGFFKASSKLDRVIPTVGAFTYDNSLAPVGAYFSDDIDQVIGAADVFGRVGKGNFAMFPWDAASDPATILCVRNSPEFQWLAKRLCAQDVRKEYATDAYIFGHKDFDRDWGINSLLKAVAVLDKSTTDTNLNGNAYPIELSYGATNTDRKSPDINPATFYSGIGFKGASAGLATNIKARKHVTAYLNHFNVAVVLGGVVKIYETPDNGYTNNAIFSADIGADAVIRVNAKPTSEHDNLLFHISSPTDTSTHYRRFLRGLVVTTDW